MRAAALALAFLALAGCTSSERGVGPLVGDLAPDFAAQPVDGQPWSLAAQRGKVVVLDLMGVNCPPCREEMPHLLALARAHATDANFSLLSVDLGATFPSLGARGADDIRRFKAEFNATWPFAPDPGRVARDFEVVALPTFVVIGPDGVLRWRQTSAASLEQFEAAIAAARRA